MCQVNGRDAQLFDQAKLLTQRCVMAHAVFLNDAELDLLSKRGTAIAHCPLSNFFFADKLLHVQHCRKRGVKVCHSNSQATHASTILIDDVVMYSAA